MSLARTTSEVGKKLDCKCVSCNSQVLPVQKVVLVKVGDTGCDFTGHPLQLQQLSISDHPVLLRQVAPQIALQAHNHTVP